MTDAIAVGYRHIDGASVYGNGALIGLHLAGSPDCERSWGIR